MAVMVLEKFLVLPDNKEIINIAGRKSGFVSWLFNRLGTDNTISLVCSDNKIQYRSSGLSGFNSMTIPFYAISSINTGVEKSIKYLLLALIFFISGFYFEPMDSADFLIKITTTGIALILVLLYYFKKNISIYLQVGEKQYGLSFKRTLLANTEVDLNKAQQAAEVIHNIILRRQNEE